MKLNLPEPIILAPGESQPYLGTQDFGADPSGGVFGLAIKGKEVHPLRHGEVTETQLHNALNGGYDLLMVIADPPKGEQVDIKEGVLVISEEARADIAKVMLRRRDPKLLKRYEECVALLNSDLAGISI